MNAIWKTKLASTSEQGLIQHNGDYNDIIVY